MKLIYHFESAHETCANYITNHVSSPDVQFINITSSTQSSSITFDSECILFILKDIMDKSKYLDITNIYFLDNIKIKINYLMLDNIKDNRICFNFIVGIYDRMKLFTTNIENYKNRLADLDNQLLRLDKNNIKYDTIVTEMEDITKELRKTTRRRQDGFSNLFSKINSIETLKEAS